jgi:MGT family glycosyltransferase
MLSGKTRRRQFATMHRSARILVAMFQGGGNIPLIMPVMARLVERGHAVRILAGPGVRHSRLQVSAGFVQRIIASGAVLLPFREPPTHPLDTALRKGLLGSWVPAGFRGVTREAQAAAWAPAWAENVAAESQRVATDLVISDFVLLGAFAAAEALAIPSVALMHTVALRPLPGMPPYGPGWAPARGPFGYVRDVFGRAAVEHIHRRHALPPLNHARASHGLPPLRSPFEQYDRAARMLMLVSAAFDHPNRHWPANLRHVGTPIDDAGAASWISAWPPSDARPLVVVSLSTLNQGQVPLLRRILLAVADINARVLVTLGPTLHASEFDVPENVKVERLVPHSAVLPQAAAMVTQCGIGTLTKALACGVPLVCVPLVGDQPDNAARVVARGAGVRLPSDAQPDQIAIAIRRVLDEPRIREAAVRLAAAIAGDGDAAENVVKEIEAVLCAAPAGCDVGEPPHNRAGHSRAASAGRAIYFF